MKLFLFVPSSFLVAAAAVIQQTGINVTADLAVAVLVNVAIVALAFGGIQATLKHLRADVDRVDKRVEQVAKRQHGVLNILVGKRWLKEADEGEDV